MYFNTKMFTARTGTAYWRLLGDPKVEFTLTHDPSKLSDSARHRLRTWMRAGYCNSPTGEVGARWHMLMVALKADYIMEQPCNACFRVQPIERDGVQIDRSGQYEKINALFLLYAASKGWQKNGHSPIGPPLRLSQAYETVYLDSWGKIDSVFESAADHPRQNTRYEPHLLKTVVRELGHPLGDKEKIAAAVKTICSPLTFKVTAREARDGRNYTLNFRQLEG